MPPATIDTGVTGLESLDEVAVVGEPYQIDDESKWTIKIELRPTNLPTESPIPAETTWYVRLDSTYPGGDIRIYPAKEGSITATYPHQRLNVAGDEETPWREGNICVARYGHIIGRSGATGEPTTADDRLRWHLERALAWVEAASKGELRREGEPYELPIFNTHAAPNRRLAFNETQQSFKRWTSESNSWGYVDLLRLDKPSDCILSGQFYGQNGESVYNPDWGDYVTTHSGEPVQGAWVLLETPPIESPWEVPETWGDLASLLSDTFLDPYELRIDIDAAFEDEPFNWLLLGFPIPEEVGGSPALIHWQPVEVADLSLPSDLSGGFRDIDRSQRTAAQINMAREPIQWMKSDNWAHNQLSRRGQVQSSLAEAKVMLLGAGALGSTVAECLVRAGCTQFLIVDGEDFEIGNLARHTLSISDVGTNKADALARRLQSLSPHVATEGISKAFPLDGESSERTAEADVVIDCTASNGVLQAMDSYHWQGPTLFCSVSMGRRGNRLFYFSAYSTNFPYKQFREEYEPWRIQEQVEWRPNEDAVPERVGCWHPASVIRMDRVMRWAGTITDLIEDDTSLPLGGTEFKVLETGTDDNGLPVASEATVPLQSTETWMAPDSGVTIELPQICLDAMINLCIDAEPLETGGILAGTITDETTAHIVRASDPPRDSTQGPTAFHRGTERVNDWLREARDSMGIQYLGEWHYHPSAPPEIGDQDQNEMNDIASNDEYGRPNPILFIIGQPTPNEYAVRGYLFHSDRTYEELACISSNDQLATKTSPGGPEIVFPNTSTGENQ